MASVSHGPATYARAPSTWPELLTMREFWAGLSIIVMWLAVLFVGVFGPSFVSTSAGGNSTTIPAGIGVALFAFLGSSAVAKFGFRHDDR